jgi:5-methylthioadenosine/S-adenosylhomocysteine deaminase
MTHDLVIAHALVVTVDPADRVIADGAVAVTGGRIVGVGTAAEIGTDAREVVDARGLLLMPGLVNTHCHAADSLFRGLIEDLALEPWLRLVWKAEAAILTPETVRLGATLGLAELLLGGVTTTMDFFWHPDAGVTAARALGVRIATGGMFFDAPAVDGLAPGDRLAAAAAFFDAHAGADDVLPGCFPHGTYTVGPESLVAAKRLAEARGGLFSVHAAETRAEQATVTARYGRSVVRHLDALGVLDPHTVLAHCVWLDDEEIAILARTGASVAHNPMSNLKLASGIARVPDLLRAGVRVTVGTDGAISGNDLDMWMGLRLAATLHRAATLDATAVTTTQALRMVTIEGAAALGAADRLGSLEPGKLADMLLVDLGRPHAAPLFDPRTHLVFSCAKADVRHVFVGGRQVVRDGVPLRVDQPGMLAEVAALVPRIAASLAG